MTKANDFIWAIASYNRPDRQPMLLMLHKMGYDKKEIILSTQTEEDFKMYKERYSDMAQIIYRKGSNVSDNKNNILDWCIKNGNKKVIICSDKVRGVQYLGRDKKLHTIEDKRTMDEITNRAFAITERLGGHIFGCHSTGNAFFMHHTISTNQQILGCFMGILDPSLHRFDPQQPLKEDFEFVLRHVLNRQKTIRFNDICLKATFHTRGGSYELWNNPEATRTCNERILQKYQGLVVKHPTRKDEQKYIGPTTTYNYSIIYGNIK